MLQVKCSAGESKTPAKLTARGRHALKLSLLRNLSYSWDMMYKTFTAASAKEP